MNEIDPKYIPDPVVAALAADGRPWPVIAAAAADSKLGAATLILAVGDALAVTDHFVITNGSNSRQVKAIVDEVEHQLTLVDGPKPLRVEGLDALDWVLLDYGDFVVHVFAEEARGYYSLERLWKDCEQVDWRPMVPEHLQPGARTGATVSPEPAIPEPDPIVERATW